MMKFKGEKMFLKALNGKSRFIILLLFCFASLLYATRSHPYISNPGKLLDGFESIWSGGSGAVVANDTTNYRYGTQSVKLTGTNGSYVNMNKTGQSLDFSSGDGFTLWYYIDDASKLSNVDMLIASESNFSKYFIHTFTDKGKVDGWNYAVVAKSEFSTSNGEDWANTMTNIRLSLTPAAGEDVSVSFDDLRFGISGKPKVIISFDDGSGSQYDKAYPIMAGNSQAGVAFVISSLVDTGNYMTLANLTTLKNAGWDISNHTMTHPHLTESTPEELETEINGMYDWLIANGFGDSAKFFAYPYHNYNNGVINKVKERHAMGRDGGQVVQEHFKITNWDKIPYTLRAYAITNTTSVATVEDLIDLTIVKSGVLILLFHMIGDAGPGQHLTADFQAISDYLKTKQDAGILEVITFSDYYNALIELEPFCLEKPAMDFNGDCKVDWLDFAIFAQSWLECNLDPESACWE